MLRSQYIISFSLTWIILGSFFAVIFSSVGPCYYALVYGDGIWSFAPLMTYLEEANTKYPIWALTTQQIIWTGHFSSVPGVGRGISAMPSMHVGIAVLQAIWGYNVSLLLGRLLTAYAAIIFIGSIHLGWHYAIDGYFSALVIPLVWWLGARIARFGDQALISCKTRMFSRFL